MKEYLKGLLGWHYNVKITINANTRFIQVWCKSIHGISSDSKWYQTLETMRRTLPGWDSVDHHTCHFHKNFTVYLKY